MADDWPESTLGAIGRSDAGVAVRVVHSAGLTRVKYAPKSFSSETSRLFTAGDDYLVRVLPEDGDNAGSFEPLLIEDATKSMTWIDADEDYLVTASEDGCIRIYQHSLPIENVNSLDGNSPTDLVCILARCSLPARCAAIERKLSDGKTPRVAVCSDELVVKVVDAGDPKRVQLITGHQRGVRSASWSPVTALLATCSSDATIKLWDLTTVEPSCIATLDGIIGASRSDAETSVEAVWHPSGAEFAVPAKTNEVVVVAQSGQQWRRASALEVPDDCSVATPTGEIACMSFCPNGRYLAVATKDGQVTVWEWSSKRPIRSKKAGSLVTSLSWHPSADVLSWSDNAGQLSRWKNVVGQSMPSAFEYIDYASKEQTATRRQRDEIDELFDGTGLEDDDDVEPLDAQQGYEYEQDSRRARDLSRDEPFQFRPSRRSKQLTIAATKKQPTFQPTATPMQNARRYLAFNMIGSLTAIDQDTHQSISFEPHDAASRRKWRFMDERGYNMASIGANGALFACPEKEGDPEPEDEDEEQPVNRGHPSTLFFKPFEVPGAWQMPGSEWSAELPKGELAVAVAMGGRRLRDRSSDTCTAVVATSKGYLRFFSGSGVQRYIWSFGQDIVTMAAGNRFLLVVYRSGLALEGNQSLRYSVIDLTIIELRQDGALPLATDATLLWAGFNAMDVPAIFDSTGVLMLCDRIYCAAGQARWTPILDTNAIAAKEGGESSGSNIRYWPVGLDSTNLLAVMLKGQTHPDASSSSRPLIQEIALSLPVIDSQSPAGALEEQVMRQNQLANLARAFRASLQPENEDDEYYTDVLEEPSAKPAVLEHEADKALLQLIQLACKSDKHQRVLDAARELHSTRTLDAAMQIGTFFHLSSLVDRIDALREYVSERRERDERLVMGASVIEAPAGPSHRRILAASSPSPAVHNEAAIARRALGGDFAGGNVGQKSYGAGRRSDLAKAGHSLGSDWPSSSLNASSNYTADTRARRSSPIGVDSDHEDSNRDDTRSTAQESSKRRSHNIEDREESPSGDARSTKRSRDTPTSPFANKTNRADSTASTFAAPSAPASKKNPFARTAGMSRDRSMHKSNSFFDRIDTASSGTDASTKPSSARTKQATLFGMMPRASTSTSAAQPVTAVAVTPSFGEASADEDSQEQDSESLRLTLSAAQRRGQESLALEETQYPAAEDEETQMPAAGEADEAQMSDAEESLPAEHLRGPSSISVA